MNIIAWLKEPSTIKALIAAAGLIGYQLDPTKVSDIVMAVGALYAAVGAFYDRTPRTPAPPADKPLTEEGLKRLIAESRVKKAP